MKYRQRFAPYPADDEDVIFNSALTSLPAANVTSYPASGTKGAFTSSGYNGAGLGGTGRIGITGLTNQVNLQNGGYIAFRITTTSICKDASLDAGSFTQSVGAIRGSNACLISCWGDTGNGSRLQLYHHSGGALTLYHFGAAVTILNPGVTSVGKDATCDVVWAMQGKLHIIYINGVEVARGKFTGNYDTNQFATIYVMGNGAFADSPFGDYTITNLQIGLRPPDPIKKHKTVHLWGDSFIENGFGTDGVKPTYGIIKYDARMDLTVESMFSSRGIKVKLKGYGYSGRSWSDSNASPQTANRATVAAANPEILIIANSVNGIHGQSTLVADYQSSLRGHIDYIVANCSNLKKLGFMSMFPFTKNPNNASDATTGVTEASNVVMAGLVDYVNATYPQIEAFYFDAFSLLGGHNYPPEWTQGYIAGTNDLHPSSTGHYNFARTAWYPFISRLL